MRRTPVALAAALVLALLAAFALTTLGSSVVFEGEGDFGSVRVTERWDGLRSLYMGEGRARQSAVYPGRPLHLESAYARVAMVGPALSRQPVSPVSPW
jgi:hypothetical protein